jgi:PIN like domain
MRKAFHQFFRPAPEKLSELWQHGLLSFDASVLLNVYGYSRKTRDDLVELIEKNAARARLPHQFGWEFARNRSSVIVKQVHNYLKVEGKPSIPASPDGTGREPEGDGKTGWCGPLRGAYV